MGEDIGLQWSIQNSTDNVVEVLYLYEPKFNYKHINYEQFNKTTG